MTQSVAQALGHDFVGNFRKQVGQFQRPAAQMADELSPLATQGAQQVRQTVQTTTFRLLLLELAE